MSINFESERGLIGKMEPLYSSVNGVEPPLTFNHREEVLSIIECKMRERHWWRLMSVDQKLEVDQMIDDKMKDLHEKLLSVKSIEPEELVKNLKHNILKFSLFD